MSDRNIPQQDRTALLKDRTDLLKDRQKLEERQLEERLNNA